MFLHCRLCLYAKTFIFFPMSVSRFLYVYFQTLFYLRKNFQLRLIWKNGWLMSRRWISNQNWISTLLKPQVENHNCLYFNISFCYMIHHHYCTVNNFNFVLQSNFIDWSKQNPWNEQIFLHWLHFVKIVFNKQLMLNIEKLNSFAFSGVYI